MLACVCLPALPGLTLRAELVSARISAPPPAQSDYFKLGTTRSPSGHEIGINSQSLLFDDRPVFPVMGEFHYTRVPESEWRAELLKMKAGGVDIVSTYVFWIHHEEIEGQWDWTGRRDLRRFVQTCGGLGLKVVVRCGPWCHGEVRNGGFPDWVMALKDCKLRSTNPRFLALVKTLYEAIGNQLQGELWKDGGPVIAIQLDNEYGGSPAYLMALKKLALQAGLDVPLYLKTGWPAMKTPVPLGELIPLFGAYPDGFWTRNIKPMDGNAWENYAFKITRTDTGVGNDTLKPILSGDTSGTEKYPYLTCEIGGGMPASYHRRINYDPRDVEAVVLTQLGSGASSLGYYMYHGGQNPMGKLSSLQESSATGYPNDLPVFSYDFNAPIGEFGQIHPQYYWLRRLHLFLHDFGTSLAQMPATLPDIRPIRENDLATLRWSVRSDGQTGYVFVNNYQRLQPMPDKRDVQFKIDLPGGFLVFPARPITIPANDFFFWPFNLHLDDAVLAYATAQPVCRVGNTWFFAETPGIQAGFSFDPKTLAASSPMPADFWVKSGRQPAISLKSRSGNEIHIVLLDTKDSLALVKAADGQSVSYEMPQAESVAPVGTLLLQSAGPAREIPLSHGTFGIALAPSDSDFTNAAVWRIQLPADLDLQSNPLLRIRYIGDVARLTLNGKLIEDNFYTGRDFDLGLKRYGRSILNGDLRLEILPLRRNAPIYIEPRNRPDFGSQTSLVKLLSSQIVTLHQD